LFSLFSKTWVFCNKSEATFGLLCVVHTSGTLCEAFISLSLKQRSLYDCNWDRQDSKELCVFPGFPTPFFMSARLLDPHPHNRNADDESNLVDWQQRGSCRKRWVLGQTPEGIADRKGWDSVQSQGLVLFASADLTFCVFLLVAISNSAEHIRH